MKAMRRAAALFVLACTALSAASATASQQQAVPDRILVTLSAMGINLDDALVQTGERNYVGSSCPGAGWTCAPEDGRPVVQIGDSQTSANVFQCTGTPSGGNTCTIVQMSPGGNTARCTLSSDVPGVSQFCRITQVSQTGNNSATIDMNVSQGIGQVQAATQYGLVNQRSTSGDNAMSVSQKIRQSANLTAAIIEQTQTGKQTFESDQRSSAGGSNDGTVNQLLVMRASANAGTTVIQHQNASSTEEDQYSSVRQQSNTGPNDASLSQKIDQQAVANQTPSSTDQIQGSDDGGQRKAVAQLPAGVSTVAIEQIERQHAVANGVANQEQYGPHICCDRADPIPIPEVDGDVHADSAPGTQSHLEFNQECNPADRYSVVQSTTQVAEDTAFQRDLAVGFFRTCGTGTVDQDVSQNGVTNSQHCEGAECDIQQLCVNGTCDTQAPETTIDSAPPSPSSSPDATFEFSASEPSTFECSLDGGAFEACVSPTTYTGLADGTHNFAVRATDLGGLRDVSPATHEWIIDTVDPDTTITAAPPTLSASPDATFEFSASEPSTFECSLDGAAFTACSSPTTYTGLSDGPHTFAVRAVDAAGNLDESPAEYEWTIDTMAPESDFDPGQDGSLFLGDPVGMPAVTGTVTDAAAGVVLVEVTFTPVLPLNAAESVDATLDCNAGATSCTWAAPVPSFPGIYVVTKQAHDSLGHVEPADEQITIIVIP